MRNLILILCGVLEIVFIVYCLAIPANRKLAGYLCALVAFVLLILTVWLLLFPAFQLPKTTGEYEVQTMECIYTDTNRIESFSDKKESRFLPVKFWYPKQKQKQFDAKCPLIVFSHGSFGVKESNVSMFEQLASHGYVVCSIDHTYMCFSTKDINGKKVSINRDYLFELMKQDPNNAEESFPLIKKWMKARTEDLNFVIDTIKEKEPAGNDVYSLMDLNRIGLCGHSLGGSAVLGLGRMRDDIDAVIALESPFMCDIKGIQENKYVFNEEEYPIPVLNVYSDSAWGHLDEWPMYVVNDRLMKQQSSNNQVLHLKGAGHLSLTDLSYSCPMLCVLMGQGMFANVDEFTNRMNQKCLDFFDLHV